MKRNRPVTVKQLPTRLDLEHARAFLRQMDPVLRGDRPQIVLDFSQVQYVDSAGVDALLKCLQEVMKRDGDLKLAAVTPKSAIILELTRLDRLFEIYEHTADAVESFHAFPVHGMELAPEPTYAPPAPRWKGPEDLEDLEAAS